MDHHRIMLDVFASGGRGRVRTDAYFQKFTGGVLLRSMMTFTQASVVLCHVQVSCTHSSELSARVVVIITVMCDVVGRSVSRLLRGVLAGAEGQDG